MVAAMPRVRVAALYEAAKVVMALALALALRLGFVEQLWLGLGLQPWHGCSHAKG